MGNGALGFLAFLQDHSFWRHHVGVFLAALLIVSLPRMIGEFGDIAAFRIVFLQSFVMVLIAVPVQTLFAVLAATYCTLCSARTASVIGCILAAIPSTALSMNTLWIAGWVVAPDSTREALWHWLKATYPAALLLHATLGSVLWMVLSYPWWQTRLPTDRGPEETSTADTVASEAKEVASPEFLKKLSPKTKGALWALSAERHYVCVTTDAGDELILLRFSDALEQCRAMDGLQTHRSHWVHRAGIKRLVRANGKMCVELRNGNQLPVSRSHQSAMARFMDDLGSDDAS